MQRPGLEIGFKTSGLRWNDGDEVKLGGAILKTYRRDNQECVFAQQAKGKKGGTEDDGIPGEDNESLQGHRIQTVEY